VIYFDTCALLKLIRPDHETAALGAFIDARPDTRWFSSEVARTELARTVRRINHDDQGAVIGSGRLGAELDQVERLCDGLDFVPVSSRVLSDAAALEHPFLRTLDAIHISTAAGLRKSLAAFVTYDKRLAAAAKEAGLPVTSPA
jgi:predicted nucleic acid-binding protein